MNGNLSKFSSEVIICRQSVLNEYNHFIEPITDVKEKNHEPNVIQPDKITNENIEERD